MQSPINEPWNLIVTLLDPKASPEERERAEYLMSCETVACLDKYLPAFGPTRPDLPPRDELARILAKSRHATREEAQVVERYNAWQTQLAEAIEHTRSNIGPLLMAARVFHSKGREWEFEGIQRFLLEHYDVEVPPCPDPVTASRVAERVARIVSLPPGEFE